MACAQQFIDTRLPAPARGLEKSSEFWSRSTLLAAVMAEVDAEDSSHHISANRYRICQDLFEEPSAERRY